MKKKRNNAGLIIVIIALIVASLGIAAALLFVGAKDRKIMKKLDTAYSYLEDEDYEMAIAAFKEVLEIDPNCVDAYLGTAKAYEEMDDYEKAVKILKSGYAQTESSSIERKIDKYEEIIEKKKEESEGKNDEGPAKEEPAKEEPANEEPAKEEPTSDDGGITDYPPVEQPQSAKMTANEARDIIDAYCHEIIPLDETDPSGEMHYIEIIDESSDYVVIDFRSYTGSHEYYTVDLNTGIAEIEEYVPAMDLTEDGGTLDLNALR